MPSIVNESNATVPFTSSSTWATDASEIGIPPGQFPGRLETTLGNKQPFVLKSSGQDYATYEQELGCIRLMVWNT